MWVCLCVFMCSFSTLTWDIGVSLFTVTIDLGFCWYAKTSIMIALQSINNEVSIVNCIEIEEPKLMHHKSYRFNWKSSVIRAAKTIFIYFEFWASDFFSFSLPLVFAFVFLFCLFVLFRFVCDVQGNANFQKVIWFLPLCHPQSQSQSQSWIIF